MDLTDRPEPPPSPPPDPPPDPLPEPYGGPATPRAVCDRLEALGLSAHVRELACSAPNSRNARFTVEDPDALLRDLEQTGRFRRDTRLGAIFHPRQISLREVASANSLHISIGDANHVSAHIDRYSPLSSNQPDGRCRYSLPRVAVHNLSGMAADVARLLPGRRR